jgi:hypothetical protein
MPAVAAYVYLSEKIPPLTHWYFSYPVDKSDAILFNSYSRYVGKIPICIYVVATQAVTYKS